MHHRRPLVTEVCRGNRHDRRREVAARVGPYLRKTAEKHAADNPCAIAHEFGSETPVLGSFFIGTRLRVPNMSIKLATRVVGRSSATRPAGDRLAHSEGLGRVCQPSSVARIAGNPWGSRCRFIGFLVITPAHCRCRLRQVRQSGPCLTASPGKRRVTPTGYGAPLATRPNAEQWPELTGHPR